MTPIPTLAQIYNGVISSIQTNFGVTIPNFGKSFLRTLAKVWAGLLNLIYKVLANIQKNAWYDTADPVAQGGTLERFGFSILGRLPYAATQGEYTCSVTGSAGATIYAETTFLSNPTSTAPGFLFIIDNDYVLTGSGDVITLRCTASGTAAALIVGDTLGATKPLVNVLQTATVTIVSVSPVDSETVEEYRAQISLHYRLAPQGGSFADYILWGSGFAGVARIYPYVASGATWEMDVYCEAILQDSSGSAPDYNYGIPTSTILDGVTAYILNDPITGLQRKPAGVVLGPANIGALAVTIYQVVITFTGSSGISSGDQSLIIAALQAAVSKIRPFISGADDIASRNDTISCGLPATGGAITPPENYVIVVIAMKAAPGAVFTGVTMTVNAISQTAYTFDNGIIPYLSASNVSFT